MIRHQTSAAILTLALVLATSAALAQDTGTADLTKYVALGDSLTAGISNGGLEARGQVLSYPAILHFQTGAGATFEQALILEPGLPTQLQLFSLTPLIIAPGLGMVEFPDLTAVPPDPGSFINVFLSRPYDNLGIPGANLDEALNTLCDEFDGNPFYCVILRNPECEPLLSDPVGGQCLPDNEGTSSVEQGLSLSPTFISVWLGSNDVLGAATSGLVIEGETITPLDSFTADYQQLMAMLTASGPGLVLANVPDVTSIPFTTTIPPFVVDPATGQPVGLLAETSTGIRQLTAADLVLLSASEALAAGDGIPPLLGGSGFPLTNDLVLDVDEIAIIDQRILDFNDVILSAAQAAGAAHVDVFSLLRGLNATGVDLGGIQYTTDFLSGGIFSYDGVHPTSFGYALIAQEFVDAINETFGGSIPSIDLGPFVFGIPGGIQIPTGATVGAVFTLEARDQMLSAMGVPDVATLTRIQQRHDADRRPARRQRDRRDAPRRERPGQQ
jgi:lysophospholipase L1-like esterase